MRRREFIKVLTCVAAAWPFIAHSQQRDRGRLVGVLMGYADSDSAAQSLVAGFREALTKLGWMEGTNLRIELRWGAADTDKMRSLAKELIDLRPDAIVASTTPVSSVLARETQTIPIVLAGVADPIGGGLAASLSHPGGNITGLTALDPALGGKWMGLLKEIAPHTKSVALLFNPATVASLQSFMPSIQAAASSFSVQAKSAPVQAGDEIEGVIAAQANPGGSLIVMPDAFNVANRERIIALTARYGVPAIYYVRFFADSGGLISYGDDRAELFRQAAGFIDRILKGAKPADLPVQAPTKYELVINLKTAKALGLDVSLHLQQRADAVVE
jgi:putative ABC transport system substrate-binding protein